MIEITRLKTQGWQDVKDSALVTIHKNYVEAEITSAWKHKILKAEHSPIRELIISVTFTNIPRWIADQLVRHHIGVLPNMGTMRPDRGNPKPREEQTLADPTVFKLTMNAQAVINISHERLCIGCVSKETRELWIQFLKELQKLEPELVFYCVPSCINRLYCKEIKTCGHVNRFISSSLLKGKIITLEEQVNLFECESRYAFYHEFME